MAKVLIPTPLRQFADKHDSVELTGSTVGEVMAALTQKFPDLRKQLFNDEGKMRSFVNVYLNDEDIRYLQKDATAVAASDTLSIVPSIAGGMPTPSRDGNGAAHGTHAHAARSSASPAPLRASPSASGAPPPASLPASPAPRRASMNQ